MTPTGTTARALAVLAVGILGAACADDSLGPPHPPDRLDFPVAVTADPRGEVVWVTSGNFDLAFRGGAVLAIDVRTNRFIPDAAFEVGGFPGPLHLLSRQGEPVAGYILSRADDALYYAQLEGDARAPTPSCPDGQRETLSDDRSILRCPRSGAITRRAVRRDDEAATLRVGTDPYGAVVRRSRAPNQPDMLLTAGMGDGRVATFTLAEDGTPTLAGSVGLLQGTFAMAEGPADGRVYATTKAANIIQVLDVVGGAVDPIVEPSLTNPFLELVAQITVPETLAADRARDAAISSDGTRLYVSYRSPDTLVVVDIAPDADGAPAGRVTAKIPVGDDPGDLEVIAGPDGRDLVYVTAFRDHRVDVVDPRAQAVVDTIRTGRGPFGLAFVDNPDIGVRRLYVANFYAESVGVIELDPASPFYHAQVAEIR